MPARALIVNCDDFGACLAANDGVEEALSAGVATSASLMVPCPWAWDAVRRTRAHPDWGVGVHLTLTSEWPRYRWRPLSPRDQVQGLCHPDGFLWPRSEDVQRHATPEEVFAECRAQVEQALAWGLSPTHLDSHMGVLQTHARFYGMYLELAERFGLPVRMAGEPELRAGVAAGNAWAADVRASARARGVRYADDVVVPWRRPPAETPREFVLRVVRELPEGVSEIFFHPAVASDELRALTGNGADRVADLDLLARDPALPAAIRGGGIHLITYRQLP